MNVFVLNCGSSSLKFQIIETDAEMIEHDADRQLAKGLIERITDRCVVLNYGEQICAGTYAQVIADPQVQEAYLGRS